MEEVKKSKKKNKKVEGKKVGDKKVESKNGKKIEVREAEEVEEVEEAEEVKVPEQKVEEKVEKKEEKAEKPEKKSKKGLVIFLVALVVIVGGLFAAKVILTKTTVTTETVKLAEDARGFSNYFKEYLTDRVEAEELMGYEFRNMNSEEILAELSRLKDGFSKVSRGVGSYKTGEYKELAEVMEADAATYLSAVRELRAIMTASYAEEGDRQLAFMRKVEEVTPELRSALYLATAAYEEDVAGFSSKGVLVFDGTVMVEVGGGVANIFLGDFADLVVAVSSDDMDETVKPIDAKKLYGYVGSRVVEIGKSLSGELESGWLKDVKAEVGASEVKLTRTKISLVMKNVWSMNEELERQGIKGLMSGEKKSVAEKLGEVVKGLKGAK